MHASVSFPVAGLSMMALLAAGCSTTRAPIETETLSGWRPVADGTYVCQPPDCASRQLAGYDAISLGPAGQAVFETNNQTTRQAFERALRNRFARGARGPGAQLRIDGPVTRSMVGATEGLTFAIAGTDSDGAATDPGHAIIVPKDGRFHMVFAFADSRSAARAAARHFINAISL